MFDYEHRSEPLLPRSRFVSRLIAHGAAAASLIVVALGIGIVGYHFAAGFGWLDSLLEAAMILSGMGPVNPLPSSAGKLFAAGYALFSGLMFVATSGIVLAPLLHRVLHRLHLDDESG